MVDKTRNNGRWTEARFKSFITSALRSAFRRWPPKYDRLKEAFVEIRINKKSGRKAKHYKCHGCGKVFPSTQIQVDHIDPVGSTNSWDDFIERLFCEQNNLQTLCISCHKKKTQKERSENK